MRIIAVVVAVVVAGFAAVLIHPPISNPTLAHELIRMARESQEARSFRVSIGAEAPVGRSGPIAEVIANADAVDARHTARLKAIVDEHGWPDDDKVGREAAHDAWQIAFLSINEVPFQQRVIQLMKAAGTKVSASDVALLTDQVAVCTGIGPQPTNAFPPRNRTSVYFRCAN